MDFWEGKYLKMEYEIANNDLERKALADLRKGYSIMECYRRNEGISRKEFESLIERAKKWELEHLCIRLEKKR